MRIYSVMMLAVFAISCGSPSQNNTNSSKAQEPTVSENQLAFLNNLASLCGKSFGGREAYIEKGRESWAHKKFVMHVTVCEDDRVYIPFHLDDDHSRTWKFIMEDDGLRFQHDHRHPDGTPEDQNLYGGFADSTGNAYWQNFPSDKHTLSMLDDGNYRQWRVALTEDLSLLSYQLYYDDKLIFQADFDLTQPL